MRFDEKKYNDVLTDAFEKNKHMKPSFVSLISLVPEKGEKYVATVLCKNKSGRDVCICINNSASKTLLYYSDDGTIEYIGNLTEPDHSYTGGCYYIEDGCVYGFPRNSNKLLKISVDEKSIDEIDIGLDASADIADRKPSLGHHYGGVLVGDNLICPPRASKYVLIIDIKNHSHKKIYNQIFESHHYNCAVLHPNGKVYFTPMQGSSVAEFDPQSEDIRLVGERVPAALFSGTVYTDGCIYCFSQHEGGLFRVDAANNKCVLVKDKAGDVPIGGSYGAITHYNGKIYNIPGNTKHFFEYDPRTNESRAFCTFDDGRFNRDKWAGGALLPNGNIFLTPCKGRFAAELIFEGEPMISEEMNEMIRTEYFKAF